MTEETTDATNVDNTTEADKKTTKTIDKEVPYSRFKEVNDKYRATESELKETKRKLEEFEATEKKKLEDKLLEEKKFEELLKAKELEIETHRKENEALKKNSLLEKVKGKIINVANKEGAIDSEDILKFIATEDLLELDTDKLNETINAKISEIKNNKAHLFNTSERSTTENGTPYQVNTSNVNKKPMTRDQMIEEALRKSHRG